MGIKLTQDEFDKRIELLNNGIVALDPYNGYHNKIRFMCQYGHIWSATPANVVHRHSGCPYCSGKKVLAGFNDLWTTRPDIAKLLKNPEDGYKYTRGSSKKIEFVCPDCKVTSNKSIDLVCGYGFVCPHCSDGISYPNKFGRAFLNQLPITNHINEYSPKWASGCMYDNYFEYNKNLYILEMDGSFHYDNTTTTKMSLEKRQEIDKLKDDMAMQHGIAVIRIDCRESNKEYIKNNILLSNLNNIFDLSLINWDLCDINAQKNLVKEVCLLYKSGIKDLNVIKDILHISIWAVRKYIQVGAQYGWCDYSIEKARKQSRVKIMTPVCVLDSNKKIIHQFNGIIVCINKMKELYNICLTSPNIIKSCKTGKPYKGLYFKYVS